MKILLATVILGLLCSFAIADVQSTLDSESNNLVAVYIRSAEYGSIPQNYAAGSNTPSPNTDHPADSECGWHINGLTFLTWFIDSSAGYVSTDTFFPGDAPFGHQMVKSDTMMIYYFALDNFTNQHRNQNMHLESGDTLHFLFYFFDEYYTTYFACFDTIFHDYPGFEMSIFVDLARTPSVDCIAQHACSDFLGFEDNTYPLPNSYYIAQNSPNPFNSATEIEYYIPDDADVTIDVFDLMGKHIKSLIGERCTAGTHIVQWNATDNKGNPVPTGSYFYKIKAGDYETQRRMLYLK